MTADTAELAPPSYYCPTCARPRGNEHHADQCVCAGTYVDRVPDGLLPAPVHVPGGQRAALANLAWTGSGRSAVIPLRELGAILDGLRAVGPKVPADVEVARTDRGWRIEAGPREQLLFGAEDGQPQRFVAELKACECDRTPCARPRCADYRHHCHGSWGRHAEHVEAFVRSVARTYRGRVTVGPVPR